MISDPFVIYKVTHTVLQSWLRPAVQEHAVNSGVNLPSSALPPVLSSSALFLSIRENQSHIGYTNSKYGSGLFGHLWEYSKWTKV
jgi:hypothetical protein